MSYHRRFRNGRARGAQPRSLTDIDIFEQALRGQDDDADSGRASDATDRKTLQLCRQVERALSMALMGDVLRDLTVDGVEPMGSAAQLLVRLGVPRSIGAAPAEILSRLNDEASRLRQAVAREISRKRTPMLHFVLVPMAPTCAEGGRHD